MLDSVCEHAWVCVAHICLFVLCRFVFTGSSRAVLVSTRARHIAEGTSPQPAAVWQPVLTLPYRLGPGHPFSV
jgi:hypothetical protein